jgi:hypothetical protein
MADCLTNQLIHYQPTNMTPTKYTVLIDRKDGGSDSEEFTTSQDAINFAKKECRWESTFHVCVIAEDADGETEIYNEDGSFA